MPRRRSARAAAAALLALLLASAACVARCESDAGMGHLDLEGGAPGDSDVTTEQSNGNEQVFDNANDDGTGTTVVLSNANKVHTLNSKYAIKEEQSKQRVKQEADAKRKVLNAASKREEERVKKDNAAIDARGKANEQRLKKETAKFQQTLEGREKAAARQSAAAAARAKRQHAARMARHRKQVEERTKQLDQRTVLLKRAQAAMRAAGGGELRLSRAWRTYGGGWQRPRAYLVGGRVAVLEGLLRGRATAGMVARIQGAIRPRGGRLIFQQLHNNRPARVDVLPDGRVYLVKTLRGGTWLSLDGISYDVRNGDESPQLLSNWQPYGGSYRQPRQTRVGDACMLSGLVRAGEWRQIMAQMSGKGRQRACLPRRRLIFGGPHHDGVQRLDLLPNPRGAVQHVPAASVRHGWVALDGMMWLAGFGKPLSLNRRWTNYDSGYMRASYGTVSGSLCVVQGLVKYRYGGWNSKHRVIARLPVGCRPRRRLVHAANAHERQVRLDVLPSGAIVWITAARHGWVSLAGIRFVAYQ